MCKTYGRAQLAWLTHLIRFKELAQLVDLCPGAGCIRAQLLGQVAVAAAQLLDTFLQLLHGAHDLVTDALVHGLLSLCEQC